MLTDLGTLGGRDGNALWIDNAGVIVGWANNLDQAKLAFLWKDGAITSLGTLNSDPCSIAWAINGKGQVVGSSSVDCDFSGARPDEHAFLWENGKMIDLNLFVPSDAFARFDTDYAFGYPAHRFAWNAARSGQKVWYYYFTYAGRSEAYAKLGAFHGLEIRVLTGWLRPSRWGEITADDQQMIDLMTGYWTQFARTGDPSGAALPPWPKYDAKRFQ